MAFSYQLYGRIQFNSITFTQFESIRDGVNMWVTNNNGKIDISYSEHSNEESILSCGFNFLVPVTGVSQAETKIGVLNSALASLPTHSGLVYKIILFET